MKIVVQLFGPLVEQTGKNRVEVVVQSGTIRDVVAAAAVALPSLVVGPAIRFAVNTDYAAPETPVKEGDVVSLIPPVGGG